MSKRMGRNTRSKRRYQQMMKFGLLGPHPMLTSRSVAFPPQAITSELDSTRADGSGLAYQSRVIGGNAGRPDPERFLCRVARNWSYVE